MAWVRAHTIGVYTYGGCWARSPCAVQEVLYPYWSLHQCVCVHVVVRVRTEKVCVPLCTGQHTCGRALHAAGAGPGQPARYGVWVGEGAAWACDTCRCLRSTCGDAASRQHGEKQLRSIPAGPR